MEEKSQDLNDGQNNDNNEILDETKDQETVGSNESESLINELNSQINDLKDRLLRQMAETENLRTRSAKILEETRDYAIFSFCKDIISVMDNLDKAIEHFPKTSEGELKNVLEGVSMTHKELENIFKKHSLELIDPKSGDKFDYNLHHAISQIIVENMEPGIIVDKMQPGYKLKDRLIRPASVVVSKQKKE